nr:thermonuclease family protein [Ancylobacter radicis]
MRAALLTERPDRHGRLAAFIATDPPALSEASLNERLVAQGLAVVRPEPGLGACLAALLAAEVSPRRARRGLWASLPLPAWEVAALSARTGRFTLLAGRVLSVGKGRAVDYLNFGRVWRKDTTLRLERTGRAALEQAGMAPSVLAGQNVLARGVVHEAGGPAITVESAAQLVRLDVADDASGDGERDGRRTGTW